jgi:hypothetical protein
MPGNKMVNCDQCTQIGVGDDDLLHLQLLPAKDRDNLFDLVSGVNAHRFARGLIADDGTVALQGTDGKDFVDHRLYCKAGEVRRQKLDFISAGDRVSPRHARAAGKGSGAA